MQPAVQAPLGRLWCRQADRTWSAGWCHVLQFAANFSLFLQGWASLSYSKLKSLSRPWVKWW